MNAIILCLFLHICKSSHLEKKFYETLIVAGHTGKMITDDHEKHPHISYFASVGRHDNNILPAVDTNNVVVLSILYFRERA